MALTSAEPLEGDMAIDPYDAFFVLCFVGLAVFFCWDWVADRITNLRQHQPRPVRPQREAWRWNIRLPQLRLPERHRTVRPERASTWRLPEDHEIGRALAVPFRAIGRALPSDEALRRAARANGRGISSLWNTSKLGTSMAVFGLIATVIATYLFGDVRVGLCFGVIAAAYVWYRSFRSAHRDWKYLTHHERAELLHHLEEDAKYDDLRKKLNLKEKSKIDKDIEDAKKETELVRQRALREKYEKGLIQVREGGGDRNSGEPGNRS